MGTKALGAGLAMAIVCGGLAAGPASGRPADVRVVAGPGAASAGYATFHAVARRGKPAEFLNLDAVAHDVVSTSGLFRSALIGVGKTAPINGVASLAPGIYPFFCTLHPNMKGKLRVVNQ